MCFLDPIFTEDPVDEIAGDSGACVRSGVGDIHIGCVPFGRLRRR